MSTYIVISPCLMPTRLHRDFLNTFRTLQSIPTFLLTLSLSFKIHKHTCIHVPPTPLSFLFRPLPVYKSRSLSSSKTTLCFFTLSVHLGRDKVQEKIRGGVLPLEGHGPPNPPLKLNEGLHLVTPSMFELSTNRRVEVAPNVDQVRSVYSPM